MRISDWSSDVCSSDLLAHRHGQHVGGEGDRLGVEVAAGDAVVAVGEDQRIVGDAVRFDFEGAGDMAHQVERRAHHLRLAAKAVGVLYLLAVGVRLADFAVPRSEEHTSELQSLMRISYAVFCLKKK